MKSLSSVSAYACAYVFANVSVSFYVLWKLYAKALIYQYAVLVYITYIIVYMSGSVCV